MAWFLGHNLRKSQPPFFGGDMIALLAFGLCILSVNVDAV